MPAGSDDRRLEGALGFVRAAAATMLLFLSGFVLPVGGPLLMLLTPQPGLRLRERAGTRRLVSLVAVVAIAVGAIAGTAPVVVYLATFALVTLLLPVILEREWSIEVTVGVVVIAVASAVLAAALAVSDPTTWFATIRQSLEQTRDEAVKVYGQAGFSAEVLEDLQRGSRSLVELVLRLSPALFLGAIASTVLLNLELMRRRQRLAGLVPVFGDLTRWKSPPELVWLLIASGYGTFLPSGPFAPLAMNVFALLAGIYFCQGLVIAQFYMRRWHSPFWVNGLVYLFIVIEWLLATGVTLVGVFDLWADFRRLDPRPVEED